MVRLATIVLVSLALACQCPPEVEHFSANRCHGRPGQTIALTWDLGQEVYQHALPGGSLQVELLSTVADHHRQTLRIHVRMVNRLDYEVRFPLSSVQLIHDGKACGPPTALDRDLRPDLLPRRHRDFVWEFPLGRRPLTGRFPVRIDGMEQWQDRQRGSSLAGPFEFPVYIGGMGRPVLMETNGVRRDSSGPNTPEDHAPEGDATTPDRWDTDRPPR